MDDCKEKHASTKVMVRCCLCQIWFHSACLELTKDEERGVYCCFDCRHIASDTATIMSNLSMVLQKIDIMKKSMDVVKKQQEVFQKSLHEKDAECKSLRDENIKLLSKVGDLQKAVDKQTWSSKRDTDTHNTLVVGSSLVKHLDEKKMINTTVICKSGAKIDDITDELKAVPADHNYNRVVILGGGNNLSEQEPKDIIESYRDTIIAAKDVSNDVTISSIPPRLTPSDFKEKVAALNAGLQVLAGEEDCKYVDHQQTFHLQSGEVNDGFLDADQIHPNLHGTNHMAKALDLACKNRQKYDVASRKFQNKRNGKSTRRTEERQTTFTDAETTNDENFNHPFWRHATTKAGWWHETNDRNDRTNNERCEYCAEFNHKTGDCGFKRHVLCRQCSILGHKQKFCAEFSR
jgi:hypothetical protein